MRFTIYKKMMLGFGAIITIMIISSTYILVQLRTVSNAAKITITSHVHVVDLAKQLQETLLDENAYAQKYLISRDKAYFTLFAETSQRVDQYMSSLLEARTDGSEQSLIREMRELHSSFAAGIGDKSNNLGKNRNQLQDIEETDRMEIMHELINRLISNNQLSIREALSTMETTTNHSAEIALLLFFCTLIAAIIGAFIIARTITRPIDTLIKGTERIARGKFEPVELSSNDEIALLANAVNDMSEKIKKINEIKAKTMQQISHEVQTPLQAMLSAHDILKNQYSGPLNTEQQELLATILRGINKLEVFSKQYLDLAKIESGMMKYHRELADLFQIVEPIVDDARVIASSKNIMIELTALPAPNIMVDVEKISIVVSNLLSNAIKYTRKDGKVWVRVGPCTLGAQLTVQDSGIGIVEEDLSKVFARFYRSNNHAAIKRGGTGVGLALVKAYTEGHGGKVSVESTVDHGSTFTVEFPAASGNIHDLLETEKSQE